MNLFLSTRQFWDHKWQINVNVSKNQTNDNKNFIVTISLQIAFCHLFIYAQIKSTTFSLTTATRQQPDAH